MVCPIGGPSGRFPPDFRPKWINSVYGKAMITRAITGCDPDGFDRVLFILNQDQVKFNDILRKENPNVSILVEADTRSAPEAVFRGLKNSGIEEGGVLIRDCDSMFRLPSGISWDRNFIAVNDLHDVELLNARNKSYVSIDSNNTIGNIHEKKVISSLFNVGAYYFKSIEEFNKYYLRLEGRSGLYVSDVIYSMLSDKQLFFAEKVSDYTDLGTWDDLLRFRRDCRCRNSIIVDVDDTICSKDVDDVYSDCKPNLRLIGYLRRMQDEGCYIVLYTSRNMNSFHNNLGWINRYTVPNLVRYIELHGIPCDELFVGKPWTGKNGFILDDKCRRDIVES